MLRDTGPKNSLGFGVTRGDLPIRDETEAGNPEAGALARHLAEHPMQKFFAAAGATLVGAATSIALLRSGGIRTMRGISNRAAMNPGGISDRAMKNYREIQEVLDEYQGLQRIKNPRALEGGKIVDDPTMDQTIGRRGFFFTEGEKERMRLTGGEVPAEWALRDEMQQRMVKMARRLPYELPAAYVSQRLISDPLLGTGPEEPIVGGWATAPIDIIGDFAQQSLKNLAFAFIPFEAGVGGTKHGFRRAMTSTAESNYGGFQKSARDVVVDINNSLQLLGQQFSDVMAGTVRASRQSTGALSSAITDVAVKKRSVVDHLHMIRHGEGGFSGWLDKIKSGEEYLGPVSQIRNVVRGYDQIKHGQPVGPDIRSSFEDIVASVRQHGGLGTREEFFAGSFYQKMAANEYSKMLGRHLGDSLDDDIAREVARRVSVTLPVKEGQKTHLSSRIGGFGKRDIYEGKDSFTKALQARLEPIFPGHGKVISTNLETAIRRADTEFIRSKPFIDDRLHSAWSESLRNVIAPQASRSLGMRRMPYADFGPGMGDDASEFLVRRSAERLGRVTRTSSGARRHTSELKEELRQLGFDPANKQELRAFLIERGDISKPWNPLGYNFFGLRAMSVQEVLDQGLISDSRLTSPVDLGGGLTRRAPVEQFGRMIQRQDWDASILDRLKAGGLYQTRHGDIVDTGGLGRSFKGVMDTIAREYKVPLIHLKPLEMLGYGMRRDPDFKGFMQFEAGGRQPFLRADDQMSDGLFWFRGRRGKGQVARIFEEEAGRFGSEFLEGTYRPFRATATDMAGRAMRYGAGESGRVPLEGTERSWFARTFNIEDHQPMSFFAAGRRFLARKDDIQNPAVFARKLMAEGKGWQGTQLPNDPAALAEGLDTMLRSWRNTSFSQNLIRGAKEDSALSKIFNIREGDQVFDIASMDASSLRRHMARLADEPLPEDKAVARVMDSARRRLLHWKDQANIQAFDQPLAPQQAKVGLHRQIDQARMDLIRYQALKERLPGTADDFDIFTTRLFREIEELFGQGIIGSRDAAQARAAIGSMQVDFYKMRLGDATRGRQRNQLDILERLNPERLKMSGVSPEDDIRRVLQDTIEYRMSGEIGRRLQGNMGLGIADYRYQGFEYNPFNVDTVFVPTFGTAFERNPLNAIRSVAGSRTWNDPESFSGAGMVSTHVFDRMNRFLSIFSLGVDATSYSGPLHMFFRGMIGERILPLYIAGTTFMAIDRTLGAYAHGDRDIQGDRIYKPLLVGGIGEVAAAGQIAMAGITPWGMTAEEKSEQLRHGEVPIRRGRFWPFGSTPWKGGKIEYFRPSWYRRLQEGYQYTDQTYGSPMERLMFGYDFSPLRPFDPYRWERKHAEERPYPVTGEYFTGPFGPATAALNLTVGRILKPPKRMHEDAVQWGMSRYQQAGAYGMSPPSTDMPMPGEPTIIGAMEGYGGDPLVGRYLDAVGSPAYTSGSRAGHGQTLALNDRYISAAATPYSTSGAQYPFAVGGGSLTSPRQPSNIMMASAPVSSGSLSYQANELAYLTQEFSGIYGFAFGAIRENLGLGSMKYGGDRPVLESAGQGYGFGRQFWDWGLGGLGDIPTPLGGQYSSLEVSELVRRFIPRPRHMRAEQDYINPIPNLMGQEHPWLPGAQYFTNFRQGDPYTSIAEGEMRLPGQGYERFRRLHPDETGRYGRLDRFMILADVAPYSPEFTQARNEVLTHGMSPQESQLYEYTMMKVEATQRRHDFRPYEFKYLSPGQLEMGRTQYGLRRAVEAFAHMDTWAHSKLIHHRTAVEDWERSNVYGTDFAQWQRPIEDFVKPALWRAADRNPIHAGAMLGLVGGMFGATPQAKAMGGMLGGIVGTTLSALAHGREMLTGERFVPARRRREIALEEHIDILEYTRALRGFSIAQDMGDSAVAAQFKQQMKSTMYGADLYGSTIEELERAVPKRKREHFREMIQAPEQERDRILSTAGRLERRIYQAAWGMDVEKRPSLEDHFAQHELPPPEWEGWDMRTNMDHVKIKMIQNEGLHASQMGYYPQQVRQANLVNPSYPQFGVGTRNPRAELERLLARRGMSGSVREIRTPFPGVRVNVNSGV